MSTDPRDPPDRASAERAPGGVVNPGRRRFARAGVGGSAVLGVMLAKPVLAADSVYHCTVSGHVSGNMSRPEGLVDCFTLGRSPGEWLASSDPRLAKVFNTEMGGGDFFFLNRDPNALEQTDTTAVSGEEESGGTVGGGSTKKEKKSKKGAAATGPLVQDSTSSTDSVGLHVTTTVTAWPATMAHVLGETNDESSQDLILGKVAAASLLSAGDETIGYPRFPLTEAGVQHMFRSVYGGSGPGYAAQSGTNTVYWDREKVIWWLEGLYVANGL